MGKCFSKPIIIIEDIDYDSVTLDLELPETDSSEENKRNITILEFMNSREKTTYLMGGGLE